MSQFSLDMDNDAMEEFDNGSDPLADAMAREREKDKIPPAPQEEDDEEIAVEEGEGWVVSFADLLSNLLLFFIVMYSISSIDEGKFNMLAKSLNKDYEEKKETSSVEILVENQAQTSAENAQILRQVQTLMQKVNMGLIEKDTKSEQALEKVKSELAEMYYVQSGEKPRTTMVEIILSGEKNYALLSAEAAVSAQKTLVKLAADISAVKKKMRVTVEGSLDDAEKKALAVKGATAAWEFGVKRAAWAASFLENAGMKSTEFLVLSNLQKKASGASMQGVEEVSGRGILIRVESLDTVTDTSEKPEGGIK